ncbi:MAG: SurA N-terminal domain-containing protein [Gammaproteobacteria bacterium]|nr:SurA N-terminal domain-containing protein [Gammaproteobacteria bacterium]
MKLVRKVVYSIGFIIISSLPLFAVAKIVDKIVAQVNSSSITLAELNREVAFMRMQIPEKALESLSEEKLRSNILEQIILWRLQLEYAESIQVKLTEQEKSEAIKRFCNSKNIKVSELSEKIEQEGMDYKQFEDHYYQEVLFQKLYQTIFSEKISISTNNIKDVMEQQRKQSLQYHIEDILVPTTGENEVEDKKAEALGLQIISQVQENKEIVLPTGVQRQDLGLRLQAELPTLFIKHLPALMEKKITTPIKAENGYHILRLLDVNEKTPIPSEAMVHQFIYQKELIKMSQDWQKEIRAKSYVQIKKT